MSRAIPSLGVAIALLFPLASNADGPTWSKKGVDFQASCFESPFKECKPLTIPSPDRKSAVKVTYASDTENPGAVFATVRVVSSGKVLGEVGLAASVENEIVWSPDSKAFFIDGNDNANGDDHFAVHRLDDPQLGPGNISAEVGEDMARSFPACKAKDPPDNCANLADDPDSWIGTVTVDWAGDSSRLVVMADIPCSSSMSGIMCQVLGYEIEVPSGKILRRMTAKEFAERWKHSMAWKFDDPGPPEFTDK